jgi:hypothetical protein
MVQSPARIGSTVESELDTADQESSLGWQNEGSQGLLRASRDECEEQCEDEGAEHDGREPDFARPPKGYQHPEDLGSNITAFGIPGLKA